MNYMRARAAAIKRNRANNDILGLLKNGYIRQKKKRAPVSNNKFGILSKAISFKVTFHDDDDAMGGNSKNASRQMTIVRIGDDSVNTVQKSKKNKSQTTKDVTRQPVKNAVRLSPKLPNQQSKVIETKRAKNHNLNDKSQMMDFSLTHNRLFDSQPSSIFIGNNSPVEISQNEAVQKREENSIFDAFDKIVEEKPQTPVKTPSNSFGELLTFDFTNKSGSTAQTNTPSFTLETCTCDNTRTLSNTRDFCKSCDMSPTSSPTVPFDSMSSNNTNHDKRKQQIGEFGNSSTFNETNWQNPPQATFEMFMERKARGARRAYELLFPEESKTSIDHSNIMTNSSFQTQRTTQDETKHESSPTFGTFNWETTNVRAECESTFNQEKKNTFDQRSGLKRHRKPKHFYVDQLNRLIREREIYKKSLNDSSFSAMQEDYTEFLY